MIIHGLKLNLMIRKMKAEDFVGKRFQNVSGQVIQFPNRISSAFCWAPLERIDIMSVMPSYKDPGFCVHNIDYVGCEVCFETAWITEEIIYKYFQEIPK
jgi:hypothetical protein